MAAAELNVHRDKNMKIACLAWGSLVWEPKDLLIRQPWFNDGPLLPIEFCRQSLDGRITLVITPEKPPVRTLWALSSVKLLNEAIESLRSRENIPTKNKDIHVGRWANGTTPKNDIEKEISDWAKEKRLDAVVWTALPPKFNGTNNVIPSIDDLITYFKSLAFEKRRNTEMYIRKAPIQIDTDYRRYFQTEFGWNPQNEY